MLTSCWAEIKNVVVKSNIPTTLGVYVKLDAPCWKKSLSTKPEILWQVLHSKHLKRPNLMIKIVLPPLFTCNLTPVHFFHLSVLNETLHLLLFKNFFLKTHPGTNVTTIDMYDDMASLKPLWQQVRGVQKSIGPIMENAKDGIHLICFSQGLPHHHLITSIFWHSCLLTLWAKI